MPSGPSAKEFFISYNHRDTAWAEWIAWQLEAYGYSTIIQAWDFVAGSNFVLDMDRALKLARKMILVLSNNYLQSSFTSAEWAAAFADDPTGAQARVVPVRIEDIALKGLLAQIVYVDLVGKDEAAARDALLAQVKAVRGKPPHAPKFPGGAQPRFPGDAQPSFPGPTPGAPAPNPVQPSAAQPALVAPQDDISVDWPRGHLYPGTIHPVGVTIPSSLDCVRIKFEYNDRLMWVTGQGKLPDTNEFVCEFSSPEVLHNLEFKLGIRSLTEECVEPVKAYFFDRDDAQIAELGRDLELVPKLQPPSAIRTVLQTVLWLIGAEPEKPLPTRALYVAVRLVLLAVVAAGYHYYRTPDPLTHLKSDLGLLNTRLVVGARPNPVDPLQEFPITAAAAVREAWSLPPSWIIEPGFMANIPSPPNEDPAEQRQRKEDGKLRLIGPGIGTFPVPVGSALYDFHFAFAVELPPQGSACWILRAQPHSASAEPASVRGYHFTLTNRDATVYLSARAVGAPARLVGTTGYNLLKADELPLQLGAPCCSRDDRIRVQIEAKGSEITHTFQLQTLVPGSDDSIEYPPDPVYTPDLRNAFPYGAFHIINTSPGPGPAYEFIRLQDAL
jgi:hypothetical protein